MEMPEQELPVVFSQMLRMFPNVPHDIVWIYVQRYSSDIEKCAQMLNLQNGKYMGLKSSSALDNSKNLNDCNSVLQGPHIKLPSKTIFDNDNKTHVTEQQLLIHSEVNDVTKEGINNNQQTECSAINSQSLHPSHHISSHAMNESDSPVDCSSNLSSSIIFHKPLALHINVDDDGSLHSWRPNLSADALCSDFFLPSPMLESFPLNSNQVSNLNFQNNVSEIEMNPEGVKQKPWICTTTPMHTSYDYLPQNEKFYGIDIASHLHFQKSQMNAIRYEVIKAKIELSDLKGCEEKLTFELKEKMQSKSVQDIERLNEEIVQLRLECQCLCTEVDYSIKDPVLLGEVDERCYEKNKCSSDITEAQNPPSSRSTHSIKENSTDIQDESHGWQCPKCTFVNHPAIKICEMCHLLKPSTRSPPFLAAAPSSCYCHPKEESLSVQS